MICLVLWQLLGRADVGQLLDGSWGLASISIVVLIVPFHRSRLDLGLFDVVRLGRREPAEVLFV